MSVKQSSVEEWETMVAEAVDAYNDMVVKVTRNSMDDDRAFRPLSLLQGNIIQSRLGLMSAQNREMLALWKPKA